MSYLVTLEKNSYKLPYLAFFSKLLTCISQPKSSFMAGDTPVFNIVPYSQMG